MDLGQLCIDTVRAQNASLGTGIEIGRAQAFREVVAWIERNQGADGTAHVESLRALCEGRR